MGKRVNGVGPGGGPKRRAAMRERAQALLANGHDAPLNGGKKKPSLSARERDCLAYVAQGMSDADIAGKLAIAPSTAHFYIEKAKQKLGAKTRAQAVAHLIASGLF
jgi:DNA-binding CsgD family transcriptional regulator